MASTVYRVLVLTAPEPWPQHKPQPRVTRNELSHHSLGGGLAGSSDASPLSSRRVALALGSAARAASTGDGERPNVTRGRQSCKATCKAAWRGGGARRGARARGRASGRAAEHERGVPPYTRWEPPQLGPTRMWAAHACAHRGAQLGPTRMWAAHACAHRGAQLGPTRMWARLPSRQRKHVVAM